RPLEEDRGPVVEGMREGRRWLDPLEPLAREIELAKERRRGAERMERGADVVDKSGKSQLGGSAAPADRLVRLIDRDGVALGGVREGRALAVQLRVLHGVAQLAE